MKLKTMTLLLISFLALSCIHENKVYARTDNRVQADSSIPRPEFLTNDKYIYSEEVGSDKIWHTFDIIDRDDRHVADKADLFKNLEQLVPRETTNSEVLNRYGLPPKVIICETNLDGAKSYYHLNFIYDELSLYFGINYEVINEIRIEDHSEFEYKGLSYNTPLETVLELYPANEVISGEEVDWGKSRVLFTNIEGDEKFSYYNIGDENMRLFIWDDKITALYIY